MKNKGVFPQGQALTSPGMSKVLIQRILKGRHMNLCFKLHPPSSFFFFLELMRKGSVFFKKVEVAGGHQAALNLARQDEKKKEKEEEKSIVISDLVKKYSSPLFQSMQSNQLESLRCSQFSFSFSFALCIKFSLGSRVGFWISYDFFF